MFKRNRGFGFQIIVMLSVVALAACASGAPTVSPSEVTATNAVSPTTANTPVASNPTTMSATAGAPASAANGVPIRGDTPSAATVEAIKNVIQKANQEQVQALATKNPALMKDTATITFFLQSVQGLNDLQRSGVTAIQLVNVSWGPIALLDSKTAQATTVETWSTTFSDGSTLQETDTNVYTLVLQSGAWKVQSDQHPNSRTMQNPSGTPNAAPTSSPAVTPEASTTPGQSQSRNWSGYAADKGTFTAVAGTWTVPNVSSGTDGIDATWVGIGGVTSDDLIQAGTQAVVQSGQVTYSAWWETLPQASQDLPLTVNAGDTVSVTITQQSDGTWQIVISDSTNDQLWKKNLSYKSVLSSAEWVEEAPSVGRRTILPLDNFGTVSFTNATTVENGQTRSIAQAGGQPITMDNGAGQALTQTSPLSANGTSFTITRTSTTAPRIGPGGRIVPGG
ncbi:MAG TPA: G1 family glutamic endopeptidase [Anaerolineaceae bacterium]|nr:G1 family glutamic endopeptidase [Anaerolineaceae bacterium]